MTLLQGPDTPPVRRRGHALSDPITQTYLTDTATTSQAESVTRLAAALSSR